MTSKFRQPILDYCARHAVTVPPGFARHTPSRYVAIRLAPTPPKLVARTWFALADLCYFVEHTLLPEFGERLPESARFLDFETGEELRYEQGRFQRVERSPWQPVA